MTSPPDPCSPGSEGSTTGSNVPAGDTPSSARSTPTGDPFWKPTGPTYPSTETSAEWEEEDLLTSVFSAEDSPAKTCPSPASAADSKGSAQASSISSPDWQTSLFQIEDGSSSRTYPDFFPPTADGISPSFSRRWPTSGFTTSPGECWTADTSECPSGGGVPISLHDV